MKKTLFLFVFVTVAVSSGAEEINLEPGKVAIVQKRDGSWVSIKSSSSPANSKSWLTSYPWMWGSALFLIASAGYKYWNNQDPELDQLEARLEKLKMSLLDFSVPTAAL